MRSSDVLRAISFLLGGLFLVACSRGTSTWEQMQATQLMRVGLDPTYPPFAVATADDLYGLDVDLAQAIADELGLEVEFVHFGYDGLYDALLSRQADVLISALVVVPERQRDFAYSDSYYDAGEILIVADGAETEISEMRDLEGETVTVELGAQGHVLATEWQHRLADLTIVPYTSADEAMAAVSEGLAAAALVDSVSGRLFLRDESGLRRVSQPVSMEPYAMVVRSEDSDLLTNLNLALARLADSGKLDSIIADWLGD